MIPYEPTKIDRPFAYNGARNDIPTEGGTETGNASLDLGFPPITSQPLSQGGIPPQRKDFNGILYLLSAYAYYAQAGGLYAWDSEIDYAVNCVITHNNNIYICIANNGASTAAGVVEPGSDESYWMELCQYLLRSSFGSVGAEDQPIYLENGVFQVCSTGVGAPTGSITLYAGTSIPSGWLICNGTNISRETYASLFAIIGTTWGSGDGSTTFTLPDFRNRVAQGSGNYSVGASVSAGLPNMSGSIVKTGGGSDNQFLAEYDSMLTYSGCFTRPSTWTGRTIGNGQSGYAQPRGIYLDASKSNSIYGTSSTVQPPALAVYYIIKA